VDCETGIGGLRLGVDCETGIGGVRLGVWSVEWIVRLG